MEQIVSGLSGLQLQSGDHLCVFYRGEAERDALLVPFLREGLRAGHKCVCVMDQADPHTLAATLMADPSVPADVADDQLDVLTSEESYLRTGAFATEAMLEFWDARMDRAAKAGYPFTRAVGEMTWALEDVAGVEELIPYEAELNRSLRQYAQVGLCFYDLNQFTNGQLLLNVMRTHPKVLVGKSVIDNPWYVEPEQLLTAL